MVPTEEDVRHNGKRFLEYFMDDLYEQMLAYIEATCLRMPKILKMYREELEKEGFSREEAMRLMCAAPPQLGFDYSLPRGEEDL
jgi:hypothetical protein